MLTLAESVVKILEKKAGGNWAGFENGNGVEIGKDIDRLIIKAKNEINASSFQDLIDRNYATVDRRGQLSDDALLHVEKIRKEWYELRDSWGTHSEINGFDPLEAIDVILTTCTMLKHFGHDIPKLMEEKVKFNEQRED